MQVGEASVKALCESAKEAGVTPLTLENAEKWRDSDWRNKFVVSARYLDLMGCPLENPSKLFSIAARGRVMCLSP